MIATIIVTGIDDVIDLINHPWGTEIEHRVPSLIAARGYQVLDFQIDKSIDFLHLLGNTYPYQATIKIETGAQASSVSALRQLMTDVFTADTGYAPQSIAVTSAGQPVPTPLPTTTIDAVSDLPSRLANALGTTVEIANGLIVVIGIAAAMLLIWIARNPKSARSLL